MSTLEYTNYINYLQGGDQKPVSAIPLACFCGLFTRARYQDFHVYVFIFWIYFFAKLPKSAKNPWEIMLKSLNCNQKISLFWNYRLKDITRWLVRFTAVKYTGGGFRIFHIDQVWFKTLKTVQHFLSIFIKKNFEMLFFNVTNFILFYFFSWKSGI